MKKFRIVDINRHNGIYRHNCMFYSDMSKNVAHMICLDYVSIVVCLHIQEKKIINIHICFHNKNKCEKFLRSKQSRIHWFKSHGSRKSLIIFL